MTRSKRLAVKTSAAATWEDVYTCPSGKVALVKWCAWFAGHSPDTGVLWLSLQPSGTSDFYIWFKDTNMLTGTASRLDTWLVLHEGDKLRMFSTYSDTRLQVHGAELIVG